MTILDRKRSFDHLSLLPGEVPFDIAEMFFSRTDERGVIQACNGVFRRVSGYEWAQMRGAPHKIVRHPDMPKGVFWLFWQVLKSGQPIGAYVKNRSADGRFYWVFAVAAPSNDGYVSVRLKPTSPLHGKVIALYEDLLADEQDGLTPEQSAGRLQQRIAEMGYTNYANFSSVALMTEMREQLSRTERSPESWQHRFLTMSDAIMQVQVETSEMLHAFRTIRTVPMNMRILASRLENAGGPISAISINYGAMLDEMTAWVHAFSHGKDSPFARIRDSIFTGQFLACAAALQVQMAQRFGRQTSSLTNDEIDVPGESARLRQQALDYRKRAAEALKVVELEAGNLARSVLDMNRYVTGLSSTRMMCKIESAALEDSGEALAGIVHQLDYCQQAIETHLARISEMNGLIQSNTAMLRATSQA
ncbi:PAS domain-containing protein [Mesobacterium sp. TK19101]|uniref:PAS domain-containing protein n=1 Tax=Mesobacterium hydrothermale TaxID=3111907 RepID=A0ABU6HKC2_9RHOB|nr:PAS domain-containing protein [Mesobacterium sp. TK19101]MEC3862904.1 PAS domain-containing protein [Mesobacterium sp. TK19101]